MRLFLLLLFAAPSLLMPAQAAPKDRRYLGAERCASCHAGEYARWKSGPHATSSRSAEDGGERCSLCHDTGDAPAGRNSLRNVQCEACHGAGRDYATEDIMRDPILSRLVGLRRLDTAREREALCMGCHRDSSSLRPFQVERAWAAIGH